MSNVVKVDREFVYGVEGRSYTLPALQHDGELWFPITYVGQRWKISNPRRLVRDLKQAKEMASPKHFKKLYVEKSDGGRCWQIALSMRGLIRMAMRSRSQGARDFRDYMDGRFQKAEQEGHLPENVFGKSSDIPEDAVTPFTFQSYTIRTTVDEDNSIWFVAKDVCTVLGNLNVSQAVSPLDDDEKGIRKVYTPGGQEVLVVNESGLYTLIIRSNKPQAKEFRRWVTHEVLPAIRRTGTFNVAGPRENGLMCAPVEDGLAVFNEPAIDLLGAAFSHTKGPEGVEARSAIVKATNNMVPNTCQTPADKADTEYVLAVARRDAMMRGVLLSDILRDYNRDAIAKAVHFRRMGLTQRETGGALGLSKDRIKRLEARLRDVGVHFDPVPVNARDKKLKEKVFDNLIPFPERPEMAVEAIQ